jgi:hypothetical protein
VAGEILATPVVGDVALDGLVHGSVVNPVGQPSKRRYPYGHISFCFCL